MRSMNVSLSDNPVYLRTSKVCLAKVCLASGGDLGGQPSLWRCSLASRLRWERRRAAEVHSVLVGAGPQPLLCLGLLPPPSLSLSSHAPRVYTRGKFYEI